MREKLLTLKEASKWLEEELGVRRAPRNLWGWSYYGTSAGVKLEVVSVGGRWHTTQGAIRRFISASTRAHSDEAGADINELALR